MAPVIQAGAEFTSWAIRGIIEPSNEALPPPDNPGQSTICGALGVTPFLEGLAAKDAKAPAGDALFVC